jgi:hypothetical protein
MDVDPRAEEKTPLKHKTIHNNWVLECCNRKIGKMMKENNQKSLGQRPNLLKRQNHK